VINEDCSLLTDVHIAAALSPGQHVDAADVADAELCEAAHQPRVEGGGVSYAVGHSAEEESRVGVELSKVTSLVALTLCHKPSSTLVLLYSICTQPLPRLNENCTKPSWTASMMKSVSMSMELPPAQRMIESLDVSRNLMLNKLEFPIKLV